MLPISGLDPTSETPIYRQLYTQIRGMIHSGSLEDGFRLPATREMAGSLGLNRTTVSSAYDLLEADGLIKGHVGRGSFVNSPVRNPSIISFSSSRPSELLFPLDAFRAYLQGSDRKRGRADHPATRIARGLCSAAPILAGQCAGRKGPPARRTTS